MLSSTMQVPIACSCCGKWLKQTEEWFYGRICTECVHRELQELINRK